MTNLLAALSIILSTNWTTVSRTTPVCEYGAGCTVLHYATLNQIGSVATNLVATFVWKGRTNQITLECLGRSAAILSQGVPESVFTFSTNWVEWTPNYLISTNIWVYDGVIVTQ